MIIKQTFALVATLALAAIAPAALAGATAQEVDRLGKDLTPVGA